MTYEKEVCDALGGWGWVEGRELRKRMNAGRWWLLRWSGPGFYGLMADLERAGVVEREIRAKQIEGETVRSHWFRAVDNIQ